MGAEVLLSCHPGIQMKCEQVVDLALFLEKRVKNEGVSSVVIPAAGRIKRVILG